MILTPSSLYAWRILAFIPWNTGQSLRDFTILPDLSLVFIQTLLSFQITLWFCTVPVCPSWLLLKQSYTNLAALILCSQVSLLSYTHFCCCTGKSAEISILIFFSCLKKPQDTHWMVFLWLEIQMFENKCIYISFSQLSPLVSLSRWFGCFSALEMELFWTNWTSVWFLIMSRVTLCH